MVARSPSAPSVPPGVALFLLAALAFGAAAAFLAAPVAAPSAPLSTGTPDFTSSDALLAVWVLLGLLVGGFILTHIGGSKFPLVNSLALGALGAILAGIVLYELLHYLGWGNGLSGGVGGSGNSTSPSGAGGNGSVAPHTYPVVPFSLPGWWVYLVLLAVVLVAVAVVLPLVAGRARRPAAEPAPSLAAEAARAAVAETLRALDAGTEIDVRGLIVALYAVLLQRIGPEVRNMETRTAREIEIDCVEGLGASRETAHEMTALFEEARYSQHPMPPLAVARARAALRRLLAELDAGLPRPVG